VKISKSQVFMAADSKATSFFMLSKWDIPDSLSQRYQSLFHWAALVYVTDTTLNTYCWASVLQGAQGTS